MCGSTFCSNYRLKDWFVAPKGTKILRHIYAKRLFPQQKVIVVTYNSCEICEPLAPLVYNGSATFPQECTNPWMISISLQILSWHGKIDALMMLNHTLKICTDFIPKCLSHFSQKSVSLKCIQKCVILEICSEVACQICFLVFLDFIL